MQFYHSPSAFSPLIPFASCPFREVAAVLQSPAEWLVLAENKAQGLSTHEKKVSMRAQGGIY